MLDRTMPHIAIAGGGIGGLAVALALHQQGIPVTVYERAAELTEVGAGLSVWNNATHVLKALGLLDAAIAKGQVITQLVLKSEDGKVLHRTLVNQYATPALGMHRADLHTLLRQQLPPNCIHLNCNFKGYEQVGQKVYVSFENGSSIECDGLIGADGIHSNLRKQLQGNMPPRYHGYPIWRGVTHTVPPDFRHEEIWGTYGTGQQFGGCAIGGDRIYWFALVNRPEQDSEMMDDQKLLLLDRFGNWHEPIPALIAATNQTDILRHNTYDCRPNSRWGEGNVTLLGDAAHLMAPTYGQGACQALEDALVLSRCVAQNLTLSAAFRQYEQCRFPWVAKLQRLSHQLGSMMQWQNPLLAQIRNATLSVLPDEWSDYMTGINSVFGHQA